MLVRWVPSDLDESGPAAVRIGWGISVGWGFDEPCSSRPFLDLDQSTCAGVACGLWYQSAVVEIASQRKSEGSVLRLGGGQLGSGLVSYGGRYADSGDDAMAWQWRRSIVSFCAEGIGGQWLSEKGGVY